MISTMFVASILDWVLHDVHVGVDRLDRLLRRVHLRHAHAVGRVDHLALQVGQVDDIVVDDPQRAHPGRRQVQRSRGAEPAGAEQQDLRVEQLLLAVGPDLGDQRVTRVALALLGRERARDLDLVPAVLPQRDSPRHRRHFRVPEVLFERARAVRRAVTRRAVKDHVRVAVGHDALDPRLQVAPRDVLGAGQVARGELVGLAHVDQRDALVDQLVDLCRVDLVDLALDLA